MPKAVPRRQPVLKDGVIFGTGTALADALNLWHKRLNVISGDIVLLYKDRRLPRELLRGWVKELRHLADGMEKHLVD